jgi:hypothetical protein
VFTNAGSRRRPTAKTSLFRGQEPLRRGFVNLWAFGGDLCQILVPTDDQGSGNSHASQIQLPAPSKAPTSEAALLIFTPT